MSYDVIVIGGGHAGCEAAYASAKLGCKTAMVIQNKSTIAKMSCNPAIGGPGKSQIVREIDALGGLMATVIDQSGIQFRTLNASKGPAVRANRAQADTKVYQSVMSKILDATENLEIIEAEAYEIEADNGKVGSVTLDNGETLEATCVIVSTGTFLNGLLHTGMEQTAGGRVGDAPSTKLSASLQKLGFELSRLKTGTPPRIDKNSIDFGKLKPQYGDSPPQPFSYFTKKLERPEELCHLTWTNKKTHEVIKGSLHRSPLFSGVIEGVGPRYCPSIEDKVVRFPDKDTHHIFLEPVSLDSPEVYPNGISTSLPADVQLDFIRTVPGLEKAEIIMHGYAVEYDFAQPTQIYPTLETKNVSGLFFAGQINGTSGYEEAAGQGLLAGINAAQKAKGKEPLTLHRSKSYIGVMVDDLTTLGTEEPYRMFTSRAEHRLVMRQDNADARLCETGYRIGLLPESKYIAYKEKQEKIEQLIKSLNKKMIAPNKDTLTTLKEHNMPEISDPLSVAQYLKRPDVTIKENPIFGELSEYSDEVILRAEIEIKYEGYIKRQEKWIKELEGIENIPISTDINYAGISGLSTELAQKLTAIRPMTFGQASRISGITPAALSILMVHLKTRKQKDA